MTKEICKLDKRIIARCDYAMRVPKSVRMKRIFANRILVTFYRIKVNILFVGRC